MLISAGGCRCSGRCRLLLVAVIVDVVDVVDDADEGGGERDGPAPALKDDMAGEDENELMASWKSIYKQEHKESR